jgi:hypothetical protein
MTKFRSGRTGHRRLAALEIGAFKRFPMFETSRSIKPWLSVILISGLLAGGLPSFVGLTVMRLDSKPAFSLDICHPLESAFSAVNIAVIVPEPRFILQQILADLGPQVETVLPERESLNDPPDSPPPR